MNESHPVGSVDALAAYGADLARWPSAAAATAARAALLADPEFRREWESARTLDARLTAARGEIDRDIAASGAMERLRARTVAAAPQPFRWRRLAAAIVLAAVLGGAVDSLLPAGGQADAGTTVSVEALVYGTDEVGL